MTEPRFVDLAERLRHRLDDVEDRFLVDHMRQQYAALSAHASLLAMQLRLAGLPVAQPPFPSPLISYERSGTVEPHLRVVDG